MKKVKKSIVIILVISIVFGNANYLSAAESLYVDILHDHSACEYTEKKQNYANAERTDGICSECGGLMHIFTVEHHCSVCGTYLSDKGWQCTNAPGGSAAEQNGPTCSNAHHLTPHDHMKKVYECGLKDNQSMGKLYISTSTDSMAKSIILTAIVDANKTIKGLAYSWGNSSASSSIEITENGKYEVTISGDNIQNTTATIEVNNIDHNGPEITLVADKTGYTSSNVIISANVSDPAGLAEGAYSWDGGNNWSEVNTYTAIENGTYTLFAKDSLGNVSQKSITINNIDRVGPEISLVADKVEYTTSDIVLTAELSDVAGLAEEAYSWDGTTWGKANTYTATANGTYTVYAKDILGNVSQKSINVTNIDRVGPEISLVADNVEYTTSDIVLTAEASDVAGLAEEAYSWDGIKWEKANTYKATTNGTYTVYAKDILGNISQKSIEVTNIDRNGPEVKLSADITEWTVSDIKISAEASDPAGLAEEAYSWDGTTWGKANTYIVTENGTYKVYVKDSLGNISETSIDISNIDKQAPEINLKVSSAVLTTNNITLTVVATDTAGLAQEAYSLDGKKWKDSNKFTISENGKYTVYVKDILGNTGKKTINITNIDREGPVIEVRADVTEITTGVVTLEIIADDRAGLAEKPYSCDSENWTTSSFVTVETNGIIVVYAMDSLGNVSSESYSVTNISHDKTPPRIVRLYADTDKTVEKVLLTAEVDEKSVWYSWDEGITWGRNNTFIVRRNDTYTVYVKDEVGNTSQKSIEITNIGLKGVSGDTSQSNGEDELSSQEMAIEESSSEDLQTENKQEEDSSNNAENEMIQTSANVKKERFIDLPAVRIAAITVPAGGGIFIFFFAFWLFTKNATVYVIEGINEKRIGKVKIKKSGSGLVLKIPSHMWKRAQGNGLRVETSKRFLKKYDGMYCKVLVNGTEVASRIEHDMHVEI